ncbi:MAG: helix-turn-helix domain-containing protein [Rhizobiaceae bacterium]|nr:helix-turn-helix domain-containing protein [Rhizobiaceae bacterium]
MPKQARLNRIKSLHPYTIEEAAEVSGVSPRTVRNWASNGLHVMDEERPALIRGDDLRAYILRQRKSRKSKTAPDTIYCVCCRRARKPAGGMADCAISGNRATLTALCEVCETVISKPIAITRIPEIARRLDLTVTQYGTTL